MRELLSIDALRLPIAHPGSPMMINNSSQIELDLIQQTDLKLTDSTKAAPSFLPKEHRGVSENTRPANLEHLR